MKRQFAVRSFVGMTFLLAVTSLAFAQHGGHGGGGHGGGGHGGGGHGGGHGFGGHGGGHGFGGHGGGHGFGGHGGGHGFGGHGGGHGFGGHGFGGHGFGGHGFGHGGYAHHWYPHFDFYVSPWYGGYGYSSYSSPAYYSGSYATGYPTEEIASVSHEHAEQEQPGPTQRTVARPVTSREGEDYQRKAKEAFRAGDFQRAARMANHALVEMPRDGKLLLFAAQTLFAVGDYRNAAAVVHRATSLLDSKDWGYVVENYRQYYRGRAFVEQMDELNKHIKENPDADYAYFLRGYQNGFLGHQPAALRDLGKAVELESRDELAGQLIERFGGTRPAALDKPALESDHGDHTHDE